MPSPRVLVVESDPSTLGLLTHGMSRLGLTAEGATGLNQALALLSQDRPDIVVSGIEGGAGLRVLEELRQNPSTRDVPMVLLAKEPWAHRRAHLRELGAQELVAKPAFVQDVAVLAWLYAGRAASSEEGFEGSFGEPSCAALLRGLLAGGRSGTLRLEPSGGLVRFREGTVIDARLSPLVGERALLRILTLETGSYELTFQDDAGAATMQFELSDLANRGLAYVRSWGAVRAQLEPLEQILMLDFEVVSAQLSDLPSGLWGLLRLFDGKRSLAKVIADAPLDDLTAGLAIVKLRRLGVFENNGRGTWDGTTPSLRHLPGDAAQRISALAASTRAESLETGLAAEALAEPKSPAVSVPSFEGSQGYATVSQAPTPLLLIEALEAQGMEVASAAAAAQQALAEIERAFYESPVEAHHWHEDQEAQAPAESRSRAPSATLRSIGWLLGLIAIGGVIAILWRGVPGGAPARALDVVTRPVVHPVTVAAPVPPTKPAVAPRPPAAVLGTLTVPGTSTATGNEVKALLEKGQRDYDHGKLSQALVSYDRAHALAPSDPSVELARGLTLYDLGKLDAASVALLDASKLDPKNARPELMLGAIVEEKGDLVAARQHYERYLALDPKGQHAGEVRKLLSTLKEE